MDTTLQLLDSQNMYIMTWEAALKILELSREWHDCDQEKHKRLIHASGAVCSMLHEAWQQRSDAPAFIKSLNDARLQVCQVRQYLDTVRDSGLLSPSCAHRFNSLYTEIHGKIDDVISKLEHGRQ